MTTYSNLKVQLIGDGEESGSWGGITNTNLGTALEEAIVGRATVDFATDADKTITLIDTNATQPARNFVLNVTSTGSLTATRTLFVPAINKPYLIENNTTGGQSIIVSNATGTGVTVPNGKRAFVFNNGTNVVDAITYLSAISLGTDLPLTEGGTGASDAAGARTNLGLGTIATQDADAVAITGGTMDGVSVTGGTVASTTVSDSVIEPRIVSVTSSSSTVSLTPSTTDILEAYNTGSGGVLSITVSVPGYDGQKIILRLQCVNARSLSWGAYFQGSTDVPLPTAASGSGKYDYMGFIYNSSASKWQLVAKNFGF